MKTFTKYILALTFILSTTIGQAQNFELKHKALTNEGINNGEYTIMLQIRGDQDFYLGYSNLRLEYNHDALEFTSINPVNFSFNTNNMMYGTSNAVDNPNFPNSNSNTLSYNIMLNAAGLGTKVEAAPLWTDIGVVTFKIKDKNINPDFKIRDAGTNAASTVVFADDNSTILTQSSQSNVDLNEMNVNWDAVTWFGLDKLNIVLNGRDQPEKVNISVFNLAGQQLLTLENESINGTISIDQHFPSGTYIINISTLNGETKSSKAFNLN